MSSTVGLQPAAPAAVPSVAMTPSEVAVTPKPADVEDIRLGFVFGMQEVRIGGFASHEMGGRGERSGSFVDGR